ncbi:non-canonical purine NTP pyrophosphatase [Candidatus Saccharibacteria bacterium]|nr:non-canonical purine NTP pyrophosphatase [Candidatus Saccharibacteria bacterium]
MKTLPIFITSNLDKVHHLNRLLAIDLSHIALELEEIQSVDPERVVTHKAKQAYEAVKKPVLVDDVSMWFDSLNGLPGPMIKLFIQAQDGLENLCRMADGLPSRRATAQAYFGIYDGEVMMTIHGEIRGEIAVHPRGSQGFANGWDSIFCPDGYNGQTRAELSQDDYDTVYSQIRPIQQLRTELINIDKMQHKLYDSQ